MTADHAHTYIAPGVDPEDEARAEGWYLSVCELDPDRFLGAVYADTPVLTEASDRAWHLVGCADVQIAAWPIAPGTSAVMVAPVHRNHLLSKVELGTIGGNFKSVRELGTWELS